MNFEPNQQRREETIQSTMSYGGWGGHTHPQMRNESDTEELQLGKDSAAFAWLKGEKENLLKRRLRQVISHDFSKCFNLI